MSAAQLPWVCLQDSPQGFLANRVSTWADEHLFRKAKEREGFLLGRNLPLLVLCSVRVGTRGMTFLKGIVAFQINTLVAMLRILSLLQLCESQGCTAFMQLDCSLWFPLVASFNIIP